MYKAKAPRWAPPQHGWKPLAAEAKILPHGASNDGRLDFIALKEHYEGVGIHSLDLVKADKVLDSLFYSGEKKPHMWWEEFEKQLTKAFAIYDKKENRQVHSDEMKLRILCKKINADFLQSARAGINIELSKVPMTMTYTHALATFRNEVNRKFPPDMTNNNNRARRINEAGSSKEIHFKAEVKAEVEEEATVEDVVVGASK